MTPLRSTKMLFEDADVQQRVFQSVMNAMARPGTWNELPASDDPQALVLATLCDPAAGFADAENRVNERVRLHIGAPVLEERTAPFVVASGEDPDAAERQSPRLGTLEDPHLSTTFVLCLPENGSGLSGAVEGPGVPPEGRRFGAQGLHPLWLERRETWVKDFPLGVDFLLIQGASVAALPRTTRLRLEAGR